MEDSRAREREREEYNNDGGRGLEEMHRITRERGSGSGVRDLFLSLSLFLSRWPFLDHVGV